MFEDNDTPVLYGPVPPTRKHFKTGFKNAHLLLTHKILKSPLGEDSTCLVPGCILASSESSDWV